MISIYTTCKDKKEAIKIANYLLKKKIAACANLFPITSLYLWKKRLIKNNEYAMFIKTNKSFKEVYRQIKKVHSYEIPCIEKINADFNKEYEEWMKMELR